MRVMVIGNSHITALTEVPAAVFSGVRPTFIRLGRRPYLDGPELDARLRNTVEKTRPDVFFSCIGGNVHNVLGLLNHLKPFDFVLPEKPDLPLTESAEILPHDLVKAVMASRLEQASFGDRLEFLKQLARERLVLHLESPPPIPTGHILSHPGPYFTLDLMRKHGIAPAPLRYKLWRVHSSLVEEHCVRLGTPFMPVPEAMMDKDGMLVQEAWPDNPTHGNAWFGERMLTRALTLAGGNRAKAPS